MLKQGVKTINAEFIQTLALSQLSFVQFRPYATSLPGLLLSLRLTSKSKKAWRRVWALRLRSKPLLIVDAGVEGLISKVNYLGN